MSNKTITISAYLIQDFLDSGNNVRITEFNWNQHRHQPDFELDVQSDMETDIDNIGEFLELQDELAVTKQELAEVGVDYEQLELGYDGLDQLHALYVSHYSQLIADQQTQIESLQAQVESLQNVKPEVKKSRWFGK